MASNGNAELKAIFSVTKGQNEHYKIIYLALDLFFLEGN